MSFSSRMTSRLSWMTALVLVASISNVASAQRSSTGRNTSATLAAFKETVAKPSESTVRILCDGNASLLGTIVSPDGFIVTKASELNGKISCKLRDGKELPARIVGIEEKHDLAMLRVDATSLRPIQWQTSKSEVGDLVASVANTELPVAIGVVSVAPRKLPLEKGPPPPSRDSGFLGIQLRPDDNGLPIIADVTKNSAAEKAGLKKDDLVISVAGKEVSTPERLIELIQKYRPREEVQIKVRRGDDEKIVKAILDRRPSDLFSRGDRMNQMGSELSRRRTGFPVVLQHDTVIKPKDCGGPLVDLDGKAVGINVARAGRTESYAIPAETVLALIPDLKSGKLAPKEVIDETKIAELEKSLKILQSDYNKNERDLKAITEDTEEAIKKREELTEKKKELQKKIKDAQEALDKARKDPSKGD